MEEERERKVKRERQEKNREKKEMDSSKRESDMVEYKQVDILRE